MSQKFVHTESMDNQKIVQAKEIVPVIIRLLNPKSVVDVGCGTGALLKEFKNARINVTGIDGKWCNKKILFTNINESEFIEADLEKPISTPVKADLAICLEVAEHLSKQRAESLIRELTEIADVVLFSAAIPNQGGQNHINEQWLPYWEAQFNSFGYNCNDVLRGLFWENEKILWWYRQNMVLFIKSGVAIPGISSLEKNLLKEVVHPKLFKSHADYRAKKAIKRHFNLLKKAILYKLKLIK